jgi:hypothetical protein
MHNSISDLAKEKGKHLGKIYGSCFLEMLYPVRYDWHRSVNQQLHQAAIPFSVQFTLVYCDIITFL